jgi:hypothetical protein
MSALEFWNQVTEKQRELVQEFVINRKAKTEAGEADPYPEQPRDYSGLFMITLKNPTAGTVGGQVTVLNFALAARRIIGENLIPVMRVATGQEIRDMKQASDAHMAASYRMEDVLHSKRTVHVRSAEPRPRGEA